MNMRKIYKKIAKKNGVSVSSVKQDMQAAIDYAYKNIPTDGITSSYQRQVSPKTEVPSTEQFICYATQKILGKK